MCSYEWAGALFSFDGSYAAVLCKGTGVEMWALGIGLMSMYIFISRLVYDVVQYLGAFIVRIIRAQGKGWGRGTTIPTKRNCEDPRFPQRYNFD